MDEYIRKQDAVSRISDLLVLELKMTRCPTWNEVYNAIGDLSPADVVPVVRCKDCKHVHCRIYHGWQEPIYTCTHLRSRWNTDNDLEVNPDGFCSYGERREE